MATTFRAPVPTPHMAVPGESTSQGCSTCVHIWAFLGSPRCAGTFRSWAWVGVREGRLQRGGPGRGKSWDGRPASGEGWDGGAPFPSTPASAHALGKTVPPLKPYLSAKSESTFAEVTALVSANGQGLTDPRSDSFRRSHLRRPLPVTLLNPQKWHKCPGGIGVMSDALTGQPLPAGLLDVCFIDDLDLKGMLNFSTA